MNSGDPSSNGKTKAGPARERFRLARVCLIDSIETLEDHASESLGYFRASVGNRYRTGSCDDLDKAAVVVVLERIIEQIEKQLLK